MTVSESSWSKNYENFLVGRHQFEEFLLKRQHLKNVDLLPTNKHNQTLQIKRPIKIRESIKQKPQGVSVETLKRQRQACYTFQLYFEAIQVKNNSFTGRQTSEIKLEGYFYHLGVVYKLMEASFVHISVEETLVLFTQSQGYSKGYNNKFYFQFELQSDMEWKLQVNVQNKVFNLDIWERDVITRCHMITG